MKKIVLGLLIILACLFTSNVYAISFNFGAHVDGIRGWNGLIDEQDTFYLGTGIEWTSDGIDNTGGYLGVNNLPISSVTNLQSNLNSLNQAIGAYGYIDDFTGYKNQTTATITGIKSNIVDITGNISTLTGNVATLSSLLASLNYTITGVQASLSDYALNSDLTTLSTTIGNIIPILSGMITDIANNSGSILALQNAGYSTGLIQFTGLMHEINTAYKLSSTKNVDVNYTFDLQMTAGILTPQAAYITLEYADNEAFTGGVTELGRYGNHFSGIDITNDGQGQIGGTVPADKWLRWRFIQSIGTFSTGNMIISKENILALA